MKFRRLNAHGLKAFSEFLNELRQNPVAPVPLELLESPQHSEPLLAPIEAEPPELFQNRMAFAQWVHTAAVNSRTQVPRDDAGFWAWLSLALFDHVCPPDANGRRKVKEDARYVPLLDSARRYYRHSLVGPFFVYWMYRDSPEIVAAVLCGSLAKLNDEAYRLFVENQLVVMPSAVELLTRLYYDRASDSLRRNSKTKKRGSIRRLATFLTRCARTIDLNRSTSESEWKFQLV